MWRKIAAIFTALYLCFLVLCSSTLFWQGPVAELFAKLARTVPFEEGVVSKDADTVILKLHEGETALLAELPKLRSADFSGSDNLQEILDWAAANPQVSVMYDVALPDGTRASSNASVQDFSGMTNTNMAEYLRCLGLLKNTVKVDLGSQMSSPDPLTGEAVVQLIENYPEIDFDYEFEFRGQSMDLEATHLDLSGISDEEAAAAAGLMRCLKKLETVELGSESDGGISWDTISLMAKENRSVSFSYKFDLYGKSCSLADESIDLSYTSIPDGGETLRAALSCMNNCKTVDLDSSDLPEEVCISLREEFPEKDIIWRIWFGLRYSVRTDTDRILASKPSVGGTIDDVEAAKLRHCTKVKYLDLGHNEVISDISFVSSMPELEVFIIAMNPVYDISPLKNCPKLEYLELNTTGVGDLSPLAESKALRHLNISNCYMTDISPLYGLTELERLWIGCLTPIPAEQVQQMQAAAPNCKISTVSEDPHGDHWRELSYDINTGISVYVPRYEKLRAQLGYDYQEYSFYWLDPKCNVPAPPEYAGIYYIHPDLLDGTAERYGLT